LHLAAAKSARKSPLACGIVAADEEFRTFVQSLADGGARRDALSAT
jgi:hypothetical protein